MPARVLASFVILAIGTIALVGVAPATVAAVVFDIQASRPEERRPIEPLLLDSTGNGFSLTSVAAGVNFDLDADGHLEHLAWTAADSDDAFVCLDITRAGRIISGSQLVGGVFDRMRGFEVLRSLDADPRLVDLSAARKSIETVDGRLTPSDPAFSTLILWVDANHNGVSEPTELYSLASRGILELNVGYVLTKDRDPHGNVFTATAQALVRNPNGVAVRTELRTVQLQSSSPR